MAVTKLTPRGIFGMLNNDAVGLPSATDTAPADGPYCRGGRPQVHFILTAKPPPCVVRDKAFDGDALDGPWAAPGVTPIAPLRGHRKPTNAK